MSQVTTAARPAAKAKAASKGSQSNQSLSWGSPVVYFVGLLLVALSMGPVLYIVMGGFRTNSQITTDPAGLPDPFVTQSYATVSTSADFWKPALTSVEAAVLTTLGVVLLGVMAAFVLARYQFKGRGFFYSLFAAGLMFPLSVAITPLYTVISKLGLLDKLAGVVLPGIAFALPTTIIILVPFLRAIPKELEEASALDGLTRLGFFWRIVLPLSGPGLITVGVLAFVASWNGYMLPLFVFNTHTPTLPLGVAQFSTQHSTDTAAVLAYTSLSMIPALLFFSIFERRIVGGLTGAVKG
ncbi:MAG: carbohydrate ABC transporter permease [Propionibacteriaceae bacterium]|jgi:raffinose/stachyose/melibiose transport system permease protein|nr:carbohydrate ABC transporter permease [Propionibacteriaceae bacterium]